MSQSPRSDPDFMRIAIAQSRQMLGQTFPNPSVGCVLVQGLEIVGQGATQPGGRPHAEAIALEQAGDRAQGSTAFVTLEPCAHHSLRGPACCDLLIKASVARVVAALIDPDPRTAGKGLERLLDAGIIVDHGLCADEAREVLDGFLHRMTTGMPLIVGRVVDETCDGVLALEPGEDCLAALQRMGSAGHMRVHLNGDPDLEEEVISLKLFNLPR